MDACKDWGRHLPNHFFEFDGHPRPSIAYISHPKTSGLLQAYMVSLFKGIRFSFNSSSARWCLLVSQVGNAMYGRVHLQTDKKEFFWLKLTGSSYLTAV
jgi:hypothetical protein